MANKQTKEELLQHLKEQVDFLKRSADAYDNGFESEAKRLATTLRVLLHDTDKSKSLLLQLSLKNKKFYDTSFNVEGKILGPYEGLVFKTLGDGIAKYIPALDDLPPNQLGKYVDFEEYWEKPIIIDNNKNEFSRKDIILNLANKDGGAHIDPKLNQKWSELTRDNSMGWNSNDTKEQMSPPEKATIRQITHEILRTLVDDYPIQKKLDKTSLGAIFGMVELFPTAKNPTEIKYETKKVGRNDPCPCGSGKKYKKCHGA